MTTPTEPDRQMKTLAFQLKKELEALTLVLGRVLDVQWDRSPVTMGPRNETGVRISTGGEHADPTADVATDPHRLYLRTVLGRSVSPMKKAVGLVIGIRRGLELALARWEGPEDE